MSNQNIKNNFFYSANSEHYQDAFLRWIFYNFSSEDDSSEVGSFAKYFVCTLLNYNGNIIDSDELVSVEVDKQKHDSDIDILIETKTKGKHLILIEDKTASRIHGSNKKGSKEDKYDTQLEKYYAEFIRDNNFKEYFVSGNIHLFYYKNDYLDTCENNQIELSNIRCEKIFKEYVKEYCEKKYDKKIEKHENRKLTKKQAIENNDIVITELKKEKEKANAVVNVVSNYTWNILDIDEIREIFKGYKKSFVNIILSDYYECLLYKQKWLDVATYPLYESGYKELSDYYKKVAWFSYLRNCIWDKMGHCVAEKGGVIGEPYWHQGGNDINIAIWAKKGDLPQLRIMTDKIRNPEEIVIQIAIYSDIAEKKDVNGKKDNSYYQNNKDQINSIKEQLQKLYNMDRSKYLIKRDDSKPANGEEKTIATTDPISIANAENKDEALMEIIKKCFNQLFEIPEEIRKIRAS